jgi:hypothetical protein
LWQTVELWQYFSILVDLVFNFLPNTEAELAIANATVNENSSAKFTLINTLFSERWKIFHVLNQRTKTLLLKGEDN